MASRTESLKDKLGPAARLVDQFMDQTSELLEEGGRDAWLSIVEIFATFDKPVASRTLGAAANIVAGLDEPQKRESAARIILGMGRPRWSVMATAMNNMESFIAIEPDYTLQWLSHGAALAKVDQDVASNYFNASVEMLQYLGSGRFDLWASLGEELTAKSWKAAKEYFKSSPEALKKIEPGDMEEWARLGMYIVEKAPTVKKSYNAHSMLAQGAAAGKGRKLGLGEQYFQSAPQILGRLSIQDLKDWVEKGLEVTDAHSEKGSSFFSLQSGGSRVAVDDLVKGLELRDSHIVLRSYAEALLGRTAQVRSSAIFYKNMPGLGRFFAVGDGSRIYLPTKLGEFDDKDHNFKLFKLLLTHEMAHIELGTFDVDREKLKKLGRFHDQALAHMVFELLEDERVDAVMDRRYPGLAKDKAIIIAAYMKHKKAKKAPITLFESISFGLEMDKGANDPLLPILREARQRVLADGAGVDDALDQALGAMERFEKEIDLETRLARKSADRIFHRGVIDFDLVENAAAGLAALKEAARIRLSSVEQEMPAEILEEAFSRLEESEGVEPDKLLWQIAPTGERFDEVAEHLRQIIDDIDNEKRFRVAVHYDEWDSGLDDYKKEWCRVREMDMAAASMQFYNKTMKENYGLVSQLKRHFTLLRPDRVQRFFREERGDEVDYNALVESMVEKKAGITPSDRVYIRREKNLRDVSVAFLVDMSYSTSEELPSGRTIVDLEKTGIILMAEALEAIGDQWAVYGFSTNRRDRADFHVVRDFGQPYNDEVKMRFGAIEPMAQTRLGAVIRHANRLVARMNTRIRLLILISDGRPYDVDYGDASYAVEDTRRALWEGKRKGVTSFCVTVDKKSRDYLPYMYGQANYTVIDNIEALPIMMPLIYKRLTT
ncbi:MAG: hypothetical protein OEZ55_03385 [Nitrospinota bacterium]|nr:hypothetical protein [Nitrospinota bacterium]MDH5755694.1 hypothetical protein [Nitrospinota bacterium]